MTIYKYCRRCGKRLKGEENRIRGYGKTCYEKAKREAQGMTPLLSPTIEQTAKELKRLEAGEARARAEAEELGKARARLQARQGTKQEGRQSKAQGKGQGKTQDKREESKDQESKPQKSTSEKSKTARPPHLEKTLTPTYKLGLLFTPHTPPPPAK